MCMLRSQLQFFSRQRRWAMYLFCLTSTNHKSFGKLKIEWNTQIANASTKELCWTGTRKFSEVFKPQPNNLKCCPDQLYEYDRRQWYCLSTSTAKYFFSCWLRPVSVWNLILKLSDSVCLTKSKAWVKTPHQGRLRTLHVLLEQISSSLQLTRATGRSQLTKCSTPSI